MRVALVIALSCAVLWPQSSLAQTVTGFVAVVDADERVQQAEVTLVDADDTQVASVLSGQNGEFFLRAPNSGTYLLRIRRIGYKPASAQILLQTDRTLEVRVNLAPQATELEGITVYGLSADTPEQIEFLSRRHLPWNFSLDKLEIEKLHVANIGEAIDFGMPIRPTGCKVVYLDGRRASLSLVDRNNSELPLGWVYGIEVYRTYFDIPIRYRDPELDPSCGAILLWTTTPPGYDSGIGTIWSLAFGGGRGWERALFELGWRSAKPDGYASTARLRFGWHVSERLLGDELARSEGVSPDAKPLFASLYFGKQGPMPGIPWRNIVYTRVAIGGSMYLGQRIGAEPDTDSTFAVTPPSSLRFGGGAELALGVRYPVGAVRPWCEIRTGVERVLQVGTRWARPVLMLGLEVGGSSSR